MRAEASGAPVAPTGMRGHRGMFRFLSTCLAFLIVTTAQVGGVPPAPAIPGEAARIESMVNKAAALVEVRGKQAFPEFRRRGSEWRFNEVYLFVMDLGGRVLLNVEFPRREGTNRLKERDADGKLFHEDFIDVVRSDGSGWVDYMFPRPGQKQPSAKWSYVRAVTIDGEPGLIGAGFYAE
jgi:cytochrome c